MMYFLAHMVTRTALASVLAVIPGHAMASQDLLETYRQAAQNDPQLQAAVASLNATRETRPQARAALLPQISATAHWTKNDTDRYGSYDANGYGINLSQSLYSYKNYATLRAADAGIAQAEFEYGSIEQGLFTRVAQTYFGVLAANDHVELVQAEKKAIARQLEQAQKRFEVGLIAITDVHEAQARYDLSVASEITTLNEVDSANEALRQITGQRPGRLAPLGETPNLDPPQPDSLETWTQKALEDNPSLLALERAMDAARQNIEVEKADYYPSISLVGSHTRSDSNGGFLPGGLDDTSLSIQLSAPIFEGLARGSRVSQAQYNLVAAEEKYEQQRRAVVRGIADAFRNVGAQISRIKALDQALTSNKSALKATQAGFDVGTRTIVDVLNAQRHVFSAVRDLKRARYDYILSRLALKQAAGTVAEQDLARINAWLR